MMFNMGITRLSKFKGMKRGVDAQDWNSAADEMVDSRWYDQVCLLYTSDAADE